MNKPVIGIFPKVTLLYTEDPFQDVYTIVNNYSKRIYEAGAIPIGLILNDGKISTEQLDLCDAFILPGGSRIDPSVYYLIQYAYDNKKPILGVCMGMQELMIYSVLHDDGANPFEPDKYKLAYDNMKANDPVLYKVNNREIHFHEPVFDLDTIRHHITIDDNSYLKSVYNTNDLDVVSLHGSEGRRYGSLLTKTAASDDGVIEAVENNELLWIGVQYHPEIDDKDILINSFIKEVERRK